MSFKTTFAAATLTLGATFANAQAYDFEREAKENFQGASAVTCFGWGAVLSTDVGSSHARFQSIKGMMKTAGNAAVKAYESKDVAQLKADSFIIPTAQSLSDSKQFNPAQYASWKARIFMLVDKCSIIYPPEAPTVK